MKPADILELPASRWDTRIAADLTAEMERHLADKESTIPEMRRFLAVKGFRELREAIERDIAGKTGADALHTLMLTMRRYGLERPGMSAATFRNAETDSPEWREAQMQLAGVVLSVLGQMGIKDEQGQHALRIIRSFARGFVLHEIGASFLEPLEHDQTYELGVRVVIEGLKVLKA